jgi:hypothetical protein
MAALTPNTQGLKIENSSGTSAPDLFFSPCAHAHVFLGLFHRHALDYLLFDTERSSSLLALVINGLLSIFGSGGGHVVMTCHHSSQIALCTSGEMFKTF